jgi:dTDP-4-dehydrorhamnose reductase
MTYLITGAAGQLGSAFVQRAERDGMVWAALTRQQLDLTDRAAVVAAVDRIRPAVIVNCAAYNAVDRAEDDASAALAVNAFAVQSLARAAASVGAVLVHYSTDFVFAGTASRPYVEEDEANPASVYGQSKLIGEWFATEAPGTFVLRVESLFGGPAARSSIDRIVASLTAGESARVFSDRVVTPSYVDDVVEATLRLLAAGAEPGLYHCVNSGATTWAELGREVARLLRQEPRLTTVNVADVPMRAPRPKYCALSNEKLRRAGFEMPTWQEALARYLSRS